MLEGVTVSDDTGFDSGNCIMMDNLQLLHLTPPGPDLAVPKVVSVQATAPDQLAINFVSLPGHVYSIQSSADIAAGFTEVQRVTATGVNTVYSRTLGLGTREFFRVEDLGVPEL